MLLPCAATDQGWRSFWKAVARSVNFEEIISRAYADFEEQTNDVDTSIIIKASWRNATRKKTWQ